jgi:O-antigen/teichoic acid export membrane protein
MTKIEDSLKGNHGHFTSGRRLARNALCNLAGFAIPLAVGGICIPILIRGLGEESFGVLTLTWALIGYASMFDLGLGRALTQMVAKKLGAGEETEIPALAWTSLLLMLILGFAGTACILLISPWLARRGLNISPGSQRETLQSFRLLALSIPFVITTTGLRGLLEAHQRFGLVTALRIPLGVATFAGPLLVLPFSKSVVPVVGTLVVGRIALWIAHLVVCLRVLPELSGSITWDRYVVGPLLRYGGWMMVSNVVSPLLITLDRFLIGALVSMTAVAFYATPYEMVTKVLVLPAALVGVTFPVFSAGFAKDGERTALIFSRCVKSLFLLLFPIMLCTIALAQDGLTLWLGAEFARHSFRVLQFLAVGVFVNGLAQVPFAFLQGAGRPELTAILHLIELPLYVALLWWLVRTRGIEGAAIAWSVRVSVDALLLFALAMRLLPSQRPALFRMAILPAIAVLTLVATALLQGPIMKTLFLGGTILCFLVLTWFRILTPEERMLAQSYR